MRLIPAFAVLIALALAPVAEARTIGEKAVENHIRPVYARLAEAMAALHETTFAFCGGGRKDRASLDAAFKRAVLAWAGAEHLRFGPIARDNRYERFAFWPDPKGVGLKQIAAALNDSDFGVTTREDLAKKSVALQGLTAFEALFWGTEAEKQAASPEKTAFSCTFARAISANLMHISAAVRDEWAAADGFAANLTAPGEGKVYRDDKDVTLEMFKAFRTALQQIRSAKLNRVLMGKSEEAQPRRAAFWRSGNAIAVIAANIAAVRDVYLHCGLYEIVAKAGQGMDKATLDEFSLMEREIAPLVGKPIADVTGDRKSWTRLNALVFALMNVQTTGGNAITEAAELPMSFNALDGD